MEGTGYLTVDTFKRIFEKLKLGTIEESEEAIFKQVSDFDEDGYINLEDFRKILTYNAEEDDNFDQKVRQGYDEQPQIMNDNSQDDSDSEYSNDQGR